MTAPLQREMLEGERKAEPWKNRLHRGFLAKRREKAVEGIVETEMWMCSSGQVSQRGAAASPGPGSSAPMVGLVLWSVAAAMGNTETPHKAPTKGWECL